VQSTLYWNSWSNPVEHDFTGLPNEISSGVPKAFNTSINLRLNLYLERQTKTTFPMKQRFRQLYFSAEFRWTDFLWSFLGQGLAPRNPVMRGLPTNFCFLILIGFPILLVWVILLIPTQFKSNDHEFHPTDSDYEFNPTKSPMNQIWTSGVKFNYQWGK